MFLFHKKKKLKQAIKPSEAEKAGCFDVHPELVELVSPRVDQPTLYRGLSLVNTHFNKVSRSLTKEIKGSFNDIIEIFFHQLYQQFIQPADSKKDSHFIEQITRLKERLSIFSSEEKPHISDMKMHDKIDVLNELICERLLCDVKAIKGHKLFNPHKKKNYENEKKNLNQKTNFIVGNWILKFSDTRNISAILFCLQYELGSRTPLDDTYRQLLIDTRDAIINAIPDDQLAIYFPTLQLEQFNESLDFMSWSNQLLMVACTSVPDYPRASKMMRKAQDDFVLAFEKLHALLDEKRQEQSASLRPN